MASAHVRNERAMLFKNLVVDEKISFPTKEEEFSEKEKKKNPSKRRLTKRNTTDSFVIFVVERPERTPIKNLVSLNKIMRRRNRGCCAA